MDTFNFPNHMVKTEYPRSSDSVQFGGAYTFVNKPVAPDQRVFVLNFAAMKYYVNPDGSIDVTTDPQNNYRVLQEFYETERLYNEFIYPHPVLGNITVRFKDPLQDPDGISGGMGAVKSFQIKLIEQP